MTLLIFLDLDKEHLYLIFFPHQTFFRVFFFFDEKHVNYHHMYDIFFHFQLWDNFDQKLGWNEFPFWRELVFYFQFFKVVF